ncbi:MAG: methylmalonyl Co-A mutase-associated GTPase MeaB [Proteobacteria bacterium]|nr:methylmalonyl Co-A mutase-associated GTPase MeaB [Pseudomonadota bacterium]
MRLGRQPTLTLDAYAAGVRAGDRAVLGRAITLVESQRPSDRLLAQELLVRLLPDCGRALRVGITGVPGVGKSTFIDALGARLLERGHRLAVLAIDPSSQLSGGSIMGDKTRMERVGVHPRAFVRPSPSGRELGGVAQATREALLVCEAAGFDVVLVETVGVGQSEAAVAEMVDFFLLLALAGAGDELQGIKRGVLELADLVAITKADGDNELAARRARQQTESALHLMRPRSPHWQPPVVTCSARCGTGLDELWAHVEAHRRALEAQGELVARRRRQQLAWMWGLVERGLHEALRAHPEVRATLGPLEHAVLEGTTTPLLAAQQLLRAFGVVTTGS